MTEKEVREFMPTIIGDPGVSEIWKEKSQKDPIEELIEYLRQASYTIIENDKGNA